ncbi:MAG: outer membrane protein [Chitinophagaceae bacterium]|nr:outer membrane protein [Chitinophagaceae bacterium]
MMKKFICFTSILSFFAITAWGQSQLLIDESFDNNDADWTIKNDDSYHTEIKDGNYVLRHKTPNGHILMHPSLLDPKLNFEVETKLTLTAGDDDLGFGLYLCDSRVSANKVNNYFKISTLGYFNITSSSAKGEVEHQGWTTTTAVNKEHGQVNVLKIKKTGSKTLFLINDQEVFKLSGSPFWGNYAGFVFYKTVELKADYFTIKQDRGKINSIETKTTLVKENLGPAINSIYSETIPVISSDGKTLYLDVTDDPKNSGNIQWSDAWSSVLKKDGTWDTRKNMGSPINNDYPNFVISVTPDNNTVILHGRYSAKGEWLGNGLSISHREETGWSMPTEMMIEDFFNLSSMTSYCLSPDRKVLLMAIERNDGLGELDLYVSFLKKDQSWTKPKNMGKTLNTFGKEVSPFISADSKTIYYSTDGKMGYGNSDIFMSRRLDDSWTKWSEPSNLGPQVNTRAYDAYYTIPASGNYAYLVSNNNSLGEEDIFRIKVAEEAKPEPVVIIHGKVLDKVTKQPLAATIDYHELSTGTNVGTARSNPTDGSYKIILPYGKAYGFLAEKNNFLAESDNIDLTTIQEYTEIERDLYLSPIEIGKTITLNNVFFVKSKAELLPGSFSELDRLVKVLTDNPELKIELSGHTDNVGDPALNTKLSEDRVVTIKNYLISKIISAKRLSGKGYGGSKPIASNATEETRKLNRRVEFIIIGK